MSHLALLKQVSFGSQIAEDETAELQRYFVETDQWMRISKGEIDIVRGEKGAGKSAIYSLLSSQSDQFFDRNILFVTAEKPRGTTVFKDLVTDPPTTEAEFVVLWKLYIITIIVHKMREYDIRGDDAQILYGALEESGLLEREFNLSGLLRLAQTYARRLLQGDFVEGELTFDPNTGLPSGVTARITLKEPIADLRAKGFNSIDGLLNRANNALRQAGVKIWVLLDRLDVAFADNHVLEANAMRALFKVYSDVRDLEHLELKIFIREDIWQRLGVDGMREASHLTKYVTLTWTPRSLLNLIIKRILNNQPLVQAFKIDQKSVLESNNDQQQLFDRLFPDQVERGPQKSTTFNWMINRCADGTGRTAPRELIHLLKSIREQEIARLEHGGASLPDDQLFDRSVFKLALPEVSKARFFQYLLAEYPDQRDRLQRLAGAKAEQTQDSLAKIWTVSREEAASFAQELINLGFFILKSDKKTGEPTYWVPFLYRDALNLVQGREKDEEDEQEMFGKAK